jgi:hypothetical protein
MKIPEIRYMRDAHTVKKKSPHGNLPYEEASEELKAGPAGYEFD